jgi:hypothetical protein
MNPLVDFLLHKMSMTDLYQPAVIRELLLHEGKRSKDRLAATLARYDCSILEYYKRVSMRWPKTTLIKHSVIAEALQGNGTGGCRLNSLSVAQRR